MKTKIDKPKKETNAGGGIVSDQNVSKKTNYTPYIVGGVILLAILAVIIF